MARRAYPSPARKRRPARPGFATGVLVAALSVAALVVGLSAFRAATAEDGPNAADAAPVAVVTVDYQDEVEFETRFPGLITARRESALGFERGGRVALISVDVSDDVAEGDRLARLDTRALEADLAAARAAQVEREAQARLAQVTLARQAELLERGHISQQDFDEFAANAETAAAGARAAAAQTDALAVQLDLADIEAPYAGVITGRFLDEGAIAQPGAPVLALVEAGALEARFGLPLREAARLTQGRAYTIETGGAAIEARLRDVTGVIDRQARTVTVVFDMPEGAPAASGDVGRLVLAAPVTERGFWAPLTALTEGARGLWTVYALAESEGGGFILEPRSVEILHTESDAVYIRGAVDSGERIVASGVARVTPGQRVRPAPNQNG